MVSSEKAEEATKEGEQTKKGDDNNNTLEGYRKVTRIKKKGVLYDYYYHSKLPRGDPAAIKLVEAKP